jgi:hypothetical protein
VLSVSDDDDDGDGSTGDSDPPASRGNEGRLPPRGVPWITIASVKAHGPMSVDT